MVRYLGPKLKIIRRLGKLPGFTKKSYKIRKKTPGQHGKIIFKFKTNSKIKRTFLSTNYKNSLVEKQKLRFNYGITESKLIIYYKKAKKHLNNTVCVLLKLLESRFDCIIYKLGYASTIAFARQLISHGHFLLNNKKVNIASFHCKQNDIITIRNTFKSKRLIYINLQKKINKQNLLFFKLKKNQLSRIKYDNFLPKYLEINKTLFIAKIIKSITISNIILKINYLKIIEYYSKFF